MPLGIMKRQMLLYSAIQEQWSIQSERTHALQAMRDGRARVCVATDVAARGIDLPNLDLVVHAELPQNHETMLHRGQIYQHPQKKAV